MKREFPVIEKENFRDKQLEDGKLEKPLKERKKGRETFSELTRFVQLSGTRAGFD